LVICLERALRRHCDTLPPLPILPTNALGWLVQKFVDGAGIHHFIPDARLDSRVRHVADWIAAAVDHDESWLKRCDKQGRPQKLLQIGPLERAEAEANKAMRRLAQKAAAAPTIDGEGEETVMTFADGQRIVRLRTPDALDRESAMMGHCVGHGAYDRVVVSGERAIYSLRDRKGRAHATLSIDATEGALLQCHGKEDRPPIARYWPPLQAFIRRDGLTLRGRPEMTGLVQDVGGQYHSVTAMPDGLTVAGDLDLTKTDITSLPRGLTVLGSLILSGCRIIVLPEDLTVANDLRLNGSGVTALPTTLTLGRGLDLCKTPVTELPENLSINGSLDLGDTAITRLPEGLAVGENLDLRNTRMTELPDRFSVGGSLLLHRSAIATLPRGLTLGGSLLLSQSAVKNLPEGLTVGGNLLLSDSLVTHVPSDVVIGQDLVLDDSAIAALPRALAVGGTLYLGSEISSLPPGLSVGGHLYPGRSAVTALPEGLVVGGDLHLSYSRVASLPEGLTIGGNLVVSHSKLTALPRALTVKKTLYLTNSVIETLGDGLTVGNVILTHTQDWSSLKAWGVKLSKKAGYNKAKVALARKLATVMLAMWRDDKPFYYNQEALNAAIAA